MKKKQTVNHKDLMELGFPEHTARDIIKQAKTIAGQLFEESMKYATQLMKIDK
ncbi:MAG: DUF3173 family protein [Streptococcus vestibularis]|nr:DUF3173 family protein [Streptococcus vestibularis]